MLLRRPVSDSSESSVRPGKTRHPQNKCCFQIPKQLLGREVHDGASGRGAPAGLLPSGCPPARAPVLRPLCVQPDGSQACGKQPVCEERGFPHRTAQERLGQASSERPDLELGQD